MSVNQQQQNLRYLRMSTIQTQHHHSVFALSAAERRGNGFLREFHQRTEIKTITMLTNITTTGRQTGQQSLVNAKQMMNSNSTTNVQKVVDFAESDGASAIQRMLRETESMHCKMGQIIVQREAKYSAIKQENRELKAGMVTKNADGRNSASEERHPQKRRRHNESEEGMADYQQLSQNDIVGMLCAQLASLRTTIDTRSDQLEAKFEKRSDEFEAKVAGELARMGTTIAGMGTAIEGMGTKLNEELAEIRTTIDTRSNQMEAKLSEEVANVRTVFDKRADEFEAKVGGELARMRTTIEGMGTEVDRMNKRIFDLEQQQRMTKSKVTPLGKIGFTAQKSVTKKTTPNSSRNSFIGCHKDLLFDGDNLSVLNVGKKYKRFVYAQNAVPIDVDCFQYEIQINVLSGYFTFGFVSKKSVEIGYTYSRNGTFLKNTERHPGNSTLGSGDLMGCSVDFRMQKLLIFKNGKIIFESNDHTITGAFMQGELFPFLVLETPGDSIAENFGPNFKHF
ncbi:hypothetical protein niasHS_010182 [Heterodera schachtii]|uniref:B30.2/SPRY domain-containing protein n=1 Tax=Heterodera schachtii TaxID=97005 RepID=A0ABD2J6X7_HETSC